MICERCGHSMPDGSLTCENCGTYLGRWARDGKFPNFTYRLRFSSLSWLGRHALILYIVHQPLIFGVCTLISWMISR